MSDCLICNRINKIKAGKNKHFIAELETGYAVLGDHQFYKGYCLFLCKQHMPELHLLENDFKNRFLMEMSWLAEGVFKYFKPIKMNYELLGNAESHLHWHLFPRHSNDPSPNRPVWEIESSIRHAESSKPTGSELAKSKAGVFEAIKQIKGINILRKGSF